MTKEIVGLIPVKGSSERVQMKNLRKFGDTSLYELKLDQISKVTGFEKVIVSSESDKVLSIAKEKGFNTHERDPKYSTNDIPMSEVYSNVASEIEGEHIAWINVTNPLAGPECYKNAILTYNNMDNKYDCMLSVSEVKDYLFYEGRPINFKTYPWQKSQDLVGVVEMNFVINICKNVFSLKIPVILYDRDFEKMRLSKKVLSDLSNRFYIARNKVELLDFLKRYKDGKLPTKWSESFIDNYIYPIANGNPGVKITEYIDNLKPSTN